MSELSFIFQAKPGTDWVINLRDVQECGQLIEDGSVWLIEAFVISV